MSFFCADAGIGPWGVDEGDKRETELLSETHETKGLAVTFWMWASKVAVEVFFGITALLLPDDHATNAIDRSETTWH